MTRRRTSSVMSASAVMLFTVVLAIAAVPAPGRAADVCDNPTFRVAEGSPFTVKPRPGLATQPKALASGTYVARPGARLDCRCDIAVALATRTGPGTKPEGLVAIMRGNDDGTFTFNPGSLLAVDPNPVAVTSGRFHRDRALDVIVVVTSQREANGRVHVFVPDDKGVYQPPREGAGIFAAGPYPAAVTTGDFNGDGELDVAIANQGNRSLTLLLGSGRGTFAKPVSVANLGGTPESLVAGRFSGDTAADDIAVSVVENVAGSGRVGVVIVPGSRVGTFAPKPVIPVGQLNSRRSSIAAANLSGPVEASGQRRWRDLAVAFTDPTPQGSAVGRVKVLLGKDGGGFGDVAAAQTHDVGASPRSITVVDLDDDGVVDLIVSNFGDSASEPDGTIRFFQGRVPATGVGFHVNPLWFTIPATTGIRPRSLVTGRFGRNGPGAPPASMGLAAINAPDVDSVSVFLGNGRGSFVQPSLVTTPLALEDSLFVSGDFHSPDGKNPLLDLAFVTRVSQRNVLGILPSNGAGGFERISSGPPFLLAGNTPRVIAAGAFRPDAPLGIAIVDETGASGRQPLLKMFFGEGEGRFKAGRELALPQAGLPRAIVTGSFRGQGMPLDIAIAGDATAAGATRRSGMLTFLVNDGNGVFTVGARQPLGFVPGSMAASSRLNSNGEVDLLIRDANENRFLFLINSGNASFRPAGNGNDGFFEGAGKVDALLVGDVASSGRSSRLDDVVTFDHDMTLKVFVNDGLESFDLKTVTPPADHPNFRGARPPYVLADFGGGKLGLAAPVVRGDGQIGLATLRGDGAGGFTVTTGDVPVLPIRGTKLPPFSKTDFKQFFMPPARTVDVHVMQGVAAQFRSDLHGNNKTDVGFIVTATEHSLTTGICAGDSQTLPEPESPERPMVCPTQMANEECGARPRPCFEGDCCHCTRGHRNGQCPIACTLPPKPPVPFQAFCRVTQPFAPIMIVYGNTCGD